MFGDLKKPGESTPSKWTAKGSVRINEDFELSNGDEELSEVVFDYERAEGGIPFIETSKVTSDGRDVEVDIIFSETYAGLQSNTGMHVPERKRDLANISQEMAHSSSSPMLWILTECILKLSNLPQLRIESSFPSHSDPKDTRKSS